MIVDHLPFQFLRNFPLFRILHKNTSFTSNIQFVQRETIPRNLIHQPSKPFETILPQCSTDGSEQLFPAITTSERVARRAADLRRAFLLQPVDVRPARSVPGLDILFHAGREAGLLSGGEGRRRVWYAGRKAIPASGISCTMQDKRERTSMRRVYTGLTRLSLILDILHWRHCRMLGRRL